MEAALGEPFLLSSYGSSQRLAKLSENSESVYATHSKPSSSSDGYVTVCAQGDGVHVLDLSTLHPIISHTLGPTTSFSGPSVSRSKSEGADHVCTTYAAIASSSDIPAEESGRTLWVWKENLSSSLTERAAQKKKSVILSHTISDIHTCTELPSRLIVSSRKGDLSILDADDKVQRTRSPPNKNWTVSHTFFFPRKSCSFLPSHSTPPKSEILVQISAADKAAYVEILAVGEEEGFVELGKLTIPLAPGQILHASCSTSGYLSILSRDGTWSSYQLESPSNTTLELNPVSETLHLKSLSFVASSSPSTSEVSILSIGSSLALLAGITKSPTREIVILLWDLRFSVLLASHTFPVPSSSLPQSSSSHKSTLNIRLVEASSPSQVLLVVSPSDHKAKGTGLKSNILVVPVTAPAQSTIANAMGRAHLGAQWLVSGEDVIESSGSHSSYSPAQKKLLAEMTTAMESNRPQAASSLFSEWVKHEETAVDAGSSTSESDVSKVSASPRKGPAKLKSPSLGYAFVKDLLEVVLQPAKPPTTLYSSEVVQALLEKKVVSANMLDAGLLAVLRIRNDWTSIQQALATVLDLSEAEVIESLRHVVVHHRASKQAKSADAMQVDTPTPLSNVIPSLSQFLGHCVRYTTSPVALRLAMRQHLSDADDVICILEVLNSWMTSWDAKEVKLLPSKKDMDKNEHGSIVVLKKPEFDTGTSDLPPLKNILLFLQTLLDASFVSLVQYPPSHSILKKINAHIEPEISSTERLVQLRGALEPFAKAQTKAVREAREVKESGGRRKEPQGDWRQRRKRAHERAGIVGLYQVEELVF